mgnify:CR=1 FL=1
MKKTTGVNSAKFRTTGDNDMADVVTVDSEQSKPVNDTEFGIVTCALLNVRESPDADAAVVTTIHKGHKLMVNENASTVDFYSVCTETGVDGYCMKQFIAV